MSKVLVPLAAAAAVVALFVGATVFMTPASDSEAGVPAAAGSGGGGGGDSGSGSGSGSGSEPDTGSAVPGNPGSGSADPGPDPGPQPPEPRMTNPMGVGIDSYHRYDERRLALSYTIGVPECYGTIATPDVVETPQSVTVTLTRVEPRNLDENVACIDIALLKSVDITLDAPLGDRVVLDGSFDRSEVGPGAAGPDAGKPDEGGRQEY